MPALQRVGPEREASLWVEVLLRAVADVGSRGSHHVNGRERRHSRLYLTLPSQDLGAVLSWCGIDPGYWHQRVVPHLRSQWREGLRPRRRHRSAGENRPIASS